MRQFEQGGGADHHGKGEGGIARIERQSQQVQEGDVDEQGHQDGDTGQQADQQHGGRFGHGQITGQ